MAEYTLVRKANVSQGSTDWEVGQYQWTFTRKTPLISSVTIQRPARARRTWSWALLQPTCMCLRAAA